MNDPVIIGDATLYHSDCSKVLPTIGMVDAVITDPPYADRTCSGARTGSGEVKLVDYDSMDDHEIFVHLDHWLDICDKWVIVWRDIESIGALRDMAPPSYIRAGFWRKPDAMPQMSGDRPAVPGEACAIFHNPGKKKWNGGGMPAYWEFPIERDRYGHPTPKPVGLIEKQVSQFTNAGDIVLDPFMGSGTTGVACANLGRKFIGIEIQKKYFDIACERIDAAHSQGRLFA